MCASVGYHGEELLAAQRQQSMSVRCMFMYVKVHSKYS